MRDDDPEQLADELEQEAEKLQRESERLGDQIDETRADWHRKQQDPQVPGADSPEDRPTPPAPEERPGTEGEAPG